VLKKNRSGKFHLRPGYKNREKRKRARSSSREKTAGHNWKENKVKRGEPDVKDRRRSPQKKKKKKNKNTKKKKKKKTTKTPPQQKKKHNTHTHKKKQEKAYIVASKGGDKPRRGLLAIDSWETVKNPLPSPKQTLTVRAQKDVIWRGYAPLLSLRGEG